MALSNSNNGTTAENVEQKTGPDWQAMTREVLGVVDKTRNEMVKQLQNLANIIRNQTSDKDGNVPDEANMVAERLENTADYLSNISDEQIEDVTRRVSQNGWKMLVVAIVVGIVIGWFVGKD